MPEEKPYELDKKDLTKDLPLMLKGIVGGLIDWLNSRDLNHDGKKDVGQLAPFALKAVPILMTIQELVDFEALAEDLCKSPAVKDQEAFKAALIELGKLAEGAGKLTPHAQ